MNLVARGTDASPTLAFAFAGHELVCDHRGVLVVPALDLLVVSDLHLEKGAAFARRGQLLPPYDTAATLERLAAAIEDYDPARVISLGDSFHDAAGSSQMPEPFRERLAGMMAGRLWHWIAGNHDPAPPQGLGGECSEAISLEGLTFRHEPRLGCGPGEVSGHLHPGARIVRRGRSVRRACFACDDMRMIMPAFGSLTGTLNVLDPAFSGLFARDRMTAYMLGRQGIYAVSRTLLR